MDNNSQNPIAQFEGYDGDTGEPLVKWYDRSNMPQPGDKLCVVGESSMSGKLALEGLTRYGWTESYAGDTAELVEDSNGTYVKFADVERLLATMAAAADNTQAQAAAPATDKPVARLHEEISDRPFSEGKSYFEITILDRKRCFDGMDLYAHPAAAVEPVAIPAGWISVESAMPEKYCLAVYENSRGRQRIIRAMYVGKFQIEASGDDCYTEINDENDTEYLREGWYELIDNWGEYSSVNVCEGVVTHWMPLPALPGDAASPASPVVASHQVAAEDAERDLCRALLRCPHIMDEQRVVLYRNELAEGSAYKQIADRLRDEFVKLAAPSSLPLAADVRDEVLEEAAMLFQHGTGESWIAAAIRALKSQRQASNQGEQA